MRTGTTNTKWTKDENGDDIFQNNISFFDTMGLPSYHRLCIQVKCRKLQDGKHQKPLMEIQKILVERCSGLFEEVYKQSKLRLVHGSREMLDLFAWYFREKRVDLDTIETDDERHQRIKFRQEKNRAWFDRFSD